MADAPKRIRATAAVWLDGSPLSGEWECCEAGEPGGTQYTRADLIDMDVLARVEAKLSAVLEACDRAKMHPRPGCGAGGMTIEANVRGSVFSGVDAWPVEEARDALADLRAMMEKINE